MTETLECRRCGKPTQYNFCSQKCSKENNEAMAEGYDSQGNQTYASPEAIRVDKELHYSEKPCAIKGLISYRYPSAFSGWIMIGAKDIVDAMREANRSLETPAVDARKLEVWNPDSKRYERCWEPSWV